MPTAGASRATTTTMGCGRACMQRGSRSNTLSHSMRRTGNALGTGSCFRRGCSGCIFLKLDVSKRLLADLKRLNSCTLSVTLSLTPPPQALLTCTAGDGYSWHGCALCPESIPHSSQCCMVSQQMLRLFVVSASKYAWA